MNGWVNSEVWFAVFLEMVEPYHRLEVAVRVSDETLEAN